VATATFDNTNAPPWAKVNGTIHNLGNWSASVIDPFNPNHVFATDGGGIMESSNLTATNQAWAYAVNGIEETVVNALISPPPNQYGSTPVISGTGDVCGFVHSSLTVSNPAFSNPTCSFLTSMDYKKTDSTYIVRVEEDAYNTVKHYGAISWNGGFSWTPFNRWPRPEAAATCGRPTTPACTTPPPRAGAPGSSRLA
jgi:hypothetical protein